MQFYEQRWEFLKEQSWTKKREVYAWLHTRSPGPDSCEFTSVDMHTQFILEKFIKENIVGIIMEVREEDYIWNAMQLNVFGRQRVEFCGKKFNLAFEKHKSCACDCLYESCRSNIKMWENRDLPYSQTVYGKSNVMMANFTYEHSFAKPRWHTIREPSYTGSDFEDPDEQVSCENCNDKMKCNIAF